MRRHQGRYFAMRSQCGWRGLVHPRRARQHEPAGETGARGGKAQGNRRSHRNAADNWWRAIKRVYKKRRILGKPADGQICRLADIGPTMPAALEGVAPPAGFGWKDLYRLRGVAAQTVQKQKIPAFADRARRKAKASDTKVTELHSYSLSS